MRPLRFSSTDLQLLERQLNLWRQRQSGRGRLPSALWESATQLGRSHGVSFVARTLRIDFYKLQRRVREGSAVVPVATPPPGFIELKLDTPQPAGTPDGWVELIDGAHRRMRIHTGTDRASWIALAESFWRVGA